MLHYATALRSSNLQQRRAAVKELLQLGSSIPSAAIAYLVPLLDDEDATVRNSAAEILAKAGAVNPNAIRSAVNAIAQMLATPRSTRMAAPCWRRPRRRDCFDSRPP